MKRRGTVYLVGAGPGDPDLISVKGVKCLQKADVVIYDRLVNEELLAYAPAWAELIYMGKEAKRQQGLQGEIQRLMVAHALQGKNVVRLKGGDPFVFGRGAEECLALAEAGIAFEIVPGISSAIAVPAYAGIPVTHRQVAQSFTVVTGHTCGKNSCDIEWGRLPSQGTLVILMGMRNLPHIARQLVESGRSANTPAAVIRMGSTEAQEVVTGTLEDIHLKSRQIAPPAIIVIGEVVRLHEQINWFASNTYAFPAATALPVEAGE